MLNIGYVSLVLVYFATKHTSFNLHLPDILRCYLSDLLCLPIVLGATLWLMRRIARKPEFTLSLAMVVVAIIAFSILFELILPLVSSAYTGDLWDVAAYAVGGMVFFFCQQWSKAGVRCRNSF